MNEFYMISTKLIVMLAILCGAAACGSSSIPTTSNLNNTARYPELEKIDFCNLVSNPAEFDGKQIETKAILLSGREYTYLYDPNCVSDEKLVWYEFQGPGIASEFDKVMTPDSDEYRSTRLNRASAVFVGTIHMSKGHGFGNDGFFKLEMDIMDAKEISPVEASVPFPWPQTPRR